MRRTVELNVLDKLPGYTAIHDGVRAWLTEQGVPYVAPDILPSELYAAASHPLTAGYESLARTVYHADSFRTWIEGYRSK